VQSVSLTLNHFHIVHGYPTAFSPFVIVDDAIPPENMDKYLWCIEQFHKLVLILNFPMLAHPLRTAKGGRPAVPANEDTIERFQYRSGFLELLNGVNALDSMTGHAISAVPLRGDRRRSWLEVIGAG
jgi:hypothetical protein